MEELPTLYQQSITKTKYARWRDDLGRRETWTETGDRFIDYISDHLERSGTPLDESIRAEIRSSILNLEVSPSMRAMMTAGPALERDNVAAYNCSYLAMNRVKAFSEILYILCCGTGVGFSVERQHVQKLPEVPDELIKSNVTIVVPDSKEGWAQSFNELLSLLYRGEIPEIDYSQVRPAGARLKTFGGRASGPGPLMDLFSYTCKIFRGATGRQLTSQEVHGIVCKTGDIVVVGGVRRSALISLSDPDDQDMRDAKTGEWWKENPHYRLANNSAVWNGRPDQDTFDKEWNALVASGSGERGFYNRNAAIERVSRIGRNPNYLFGLNPCGEIILRDMQFCNLTEVTVRAEDTLDILLNKVRLATIIGMIQSTFTEFRFLDPEWKKNCEEERLLGVSTTGDMDHPILSGQKGWDRMEGYLSEMHKEAWQTARQWATILNINIPAAITTGKPSGNNSQRLNTASGAHARYAEFIKRSTRMSKNDPVAQLLWAEGVPCEDDVWAKDTTFVFYWPVKSPVGALTRHDITALYQLQHWLVKSRAWCDHNQSITINVRKHEWDEVGKFVYDNFDEMLGVSFLPDEDHIYQQAPYQEITEQEFNDLTAEMPESIDWAMLTAYETDDKTEGSQELACVAGSCEV